ncbi:WecB/TagA/CpsF family glycosyltransferase [Pseudomonas entomophila]|uniref:WecB/TagA/CpsF family glycosyltransferase n=2 Tax=Pseudomonas entomophila TaxID=312306 RepID=A0ABY9QIW1_9PSED|nr:WecB/TagA/CpsF family glycosyltransferase [Pseudomonas entomophila]WMW03973.1 WecB/TagA/CpsF family glycosyltransferase [Pseudomonas entomophila]CAK15256.1 putative glycosyl transferase, WecB/TagA/CpsF family [Pseudomonas entomophila L48]
MDRHAWRIRWKSLVETLHVVGDPSAEQRLIERLSRPDKTTVLAFVNAHAMNLATHNVEFGKALTMADVLLRDGSGMAILLRQLGLEPGLNMNGTDFIPKLLAAYKGRRVAFWGTREPYLGQAVSRSVECFGIQPVSVRDGFAELDNYLRLARETQPELIVLGMGMPKQEALAAALAVNGEPCVVVCGGAILDFLGGKVERAPQWLRRLGGEWVFRLAREPRRLFMRYVVGNPLFLLRAVLLRKAVAKGA